jgi:peptidyl-tRNA hydrolase
MNNATKKGYDAPFLDEEEKDLIESFEAAVDAGEIAPHTAEEIETIRQDWKGVLDNTLKKRAITLRLQERDIRRLKAQAREMGLPYQTYISSVLHQLASGKLTTR